MENTSYVRQIDTLGRIVIPQELRQTFGINQGDSLELSRDANNIIIQKHAAGCSFCGSSDDLHPIGKKLICPKCLDELTASIQKKQE